MFQGGKGLKKISQETQSSVTKLFKSLKEKCSDCNSETVNLMKAKRKTTKSNPHTDNKYCDCADVAQQTSNSCPKNRDDTSSFTSCSLKKLLASESPKIMMGLIVIVGALAILFLLKCICCPTIISDLTEERRDRRSDDAIKDDRKPWEKSRSRLMSEFSELTGKDSKESNFHSGGCPYADDDNPLPQSIRDHGRYEMSETSNFKDADYPEYMLPELSSILDPIKVNEGYGSNNLREFYRKLLKTDIQIKNLKKGFTNIKRGNSLDFTDPNSPRLKRSPKIFTDPAGSRDRPASLNKRRLENLNKFYVSDAWKVDKDDGKVLQDDLGAVAKPDLNSPMEKSVEKQKLLMTEKKTEPEHTATDKGNNLYTHHPAESKAKKALEHLHFKHYALFNALFGRERPSTQHRRLLQHEDDVDKDEGESGEYEEQTKEPWDREKREVKPEDLHNDKQTDSVEAVNLPKTTNSERKESKPVYNDEINYLIEAAIRMATGKVYATENKENYLSALTDTNKEYFEDNGNYDGVLKMAQAYSDYGVLDGKKEITEKNKALGNTYNLLATKKPNEILEQINKIDNFLRGQRVKLKSNNETNTDKANFLKKFRLKMFSKTKDNILESTAIPATSKIADSSRFTVTCTAWNIFTQKKAQKHKERNVLYSGHRRSLKSVEIEDSNDDTKATNIGFEENVNNTVKFEDYKDSTTTNVKTYTNNRDLGSTNEYSKSDIINETNKNNVSDNYENISSKLNETTLKRNNTSWSLGEIFGMLADFSMFMSEFDENREESGYRFLHDVVTKLNPNSFQIKNNTTPDIFINDTRAPIDVSIDSAMVDNIGHRSRVLMSFEEKTINSTAANGLDKGDRSESYVITTNKENTNATQENKTANSSIIESKKVIESGNRTVVKRSANGNVIFWNDLYDDEYGIKDPMEDDMKDKSAVKFNDLIGKDNWISNKFRVLAKNLKERRNRKMEAKKNRKFKNARNKTKSHTKRAVPTPDVSGKQMFEGLTANMKKVCHEAAQAIRDSTNREVRADSSQASTLMQQLVSLMSELVDLQVRAKTCIQLPEDLRSFLAWLTSPNTEERDDMDFSVNSYDAGSDNIHNTETYDLLSTNARSECLGTIHDVEDLIMQYDEMSEEDKSKMSGVREYLEHQLHYLHKQLSSFNEFESLVMYQEQPIRRRRQQNSNKKQRKRKAYRFLNYGRKYTKPTEFDDFGTEDYKSLKFSKNKGRNEYYKHDSIKNVEPIENSGNDDVDSDNTKTENGLKRNLNDGYYKDLVKKNDTISNLVGHSFLDFD